MDHKIRRPFTAFQGGLPLGEIMIPAAWLPGFASAASGLLDRLDVGPAATVLLQGFGLEPLARPLVEGDGRRRNGFLAPVPPADEPGLRAALGGGDGWVTLRSGVDPAARSIPIEAHTLDLAIVTWQFASAPTAPVLVVWKELLRPGGRFATLLWADGSPRAPLKCLVEAMRIETGQKVKQAPVGFPASAAALREAALAAGFDNARAWEDAMVLPFPDPTAVFDQVWPSLGPTAAKFDARRIEAIRARFAALLDVALQGARPLPIAHDYCGLIAERA